MEATTSYSKFGRSKFELSTSHAKVDVLSEPKRHLTIYHHFSELADRIGQSEPKQPPRIQLLIFEKQI